MKTGWGPVPMSSHQSKVKEEEHMNVIAHSLHSPYRRASYTVYPMTKMTKERMFVEPTGSRPAWFDNVKALLTPQALLWLTAEQGKSDRQTLCSTHATSRRVSSNSYKTQKNSPLVRGR